MSLWLLRPIGKAVVIDPFDDELANGFVVSADSEERAKSIVARIFRYKGEDAQLSLDLFTCRELTTNEPEGIVMSDIDSSALFY